MRATALIEPGPVDRLLTVARATPADWSTTKADPHNEWTNRRGPVRGVKYLIADALGSARGVVDGSSGSLTASTAYDAWGNPETSGGLANYTPFGYAGGYTDATGLSYLIYRYYDPQTGQFVSVDPKVGQTGASYIYASDNPISLSDPNGLMAIGECAGVSGVWGIWGFTFSGCLTHVVTGATSETGLVGTVGGGLGLGIDGISGGIYYEISNATHLSELSRWFMFFTVNVDFGFAGASAIVYYTPDQHIIGVGVGVTVGTPGISGVAGGSYSWVTSFSGGYAWGAKEVWDHLKLPGINKVYGAGLLKWARTEIVHRVSAGPHALCGAG